MTLEQRSLNVVLTLFFWLWTGFCRLGRKWVFSTCGVYQRHLLQLTYLVLRAPRLDKTVLRGSGIYELIHQDIVFLDWIALRNNKHRFRCGSCELEILIKKTDSDWILLICPTNENKKKNNEKKTQLESMYYINLLRSNPIKENL